MMLFIDDDDDKEQQQSPQLFVYTATGVDTVLLNSDEFTEIMSNITKTLHMNTPEQTTLNGMELDDDEDNKESHERQLVEHLQAQLAQDQSRRVQRRDYGRILRQYNAPINRYHGPPNTRSVYYYDPFWQKQFAQKQRVPSSSPRRTTPTVYPIPPPARVPDRHIPLSNLNRNQSSQVTPRTKYMLDLYNTVLYQQQQRVTTPVPVSPTLSRKNVSQHHLPIPTRSSQVPTLPSITATKQRNGASVSLVAHDELEHETLTANGKGFSSQRPSVQSASTSNLSRRKLRQVIIPPST